MKLLGPWLTLIKPVQARPEGRLHAVLIAQHLLISSVGALNGGEVTPQQPASLTEIYHPSLRRAGCHAILFYSGCFPCTKGKGRGLWAQGPEKDTQSGMSQLRAAKGWQDAEAPRWSTAFL